MFFTQEDYKKIQQWLTKNSVKDTEFKEASIPFNGEEIITIVQGNQNKRVFLKDLIAQVSDFVNITDKYNAPNISLEEAIKLIPSRARKEGQVITFLDKEDHWYIYQFKGALNQWNILDTWEDLFDWEKLIINSILPDEEDLTKSLPDANGNSYLSLKDRKYKPEDFSGLGRVILRKNIMEVEDSIYGKVKKNVLYQDMFTQSNTVYEIRYDFDFNNQTITIPENCILKYEGGSLNNGHIVYQNTKIQGIESLNNVTTEGLFVVIDAVSDEEDLHNNNGVLKFADREYNPNTFSGLGKIILRKNTVNSKNILTQDMINKENTIYVIQYDFILVRDITIPKNCVLEFDGGSISGQHTLTGANTGINAGLVKILGTDITLAGSWNVVEAYPEWFGAKGDGITDDRLAIDRTFAYFDNISFAAKTYKIICVESTVFAIDKSISIHGVFEATVIQFANTNENTICFLLNRDLIKIENIILKGIEGETKGIGIKHQNNHRNPSYGRSLHLTNVKVWYFHDGIIANSYLNTFRWVECAHCVNGFYLGTEANVDMTSNTLICCFARSCSGIGYKIIRLIYSSLISCASDLCSVAYDLQDSENLTLVSCGCEDCEKAFNIKSSSNIGIHNQRIYNPNAIEESVYNKLIDVATCSEITFFSLQRSVNETNKSHKYITVGNSMYPFVPCVRFAYCNDYNLNILEAVVSTGAYPNNIEFVGCGKTVINDNSRPNAIYAALGTQLFDRTQKRPIYWSENGWYDAAGYKAVINKGATRPTGLTANDNGLDFFDTNLKKHLSWDNNYGFVEYDGILAGVKRSGTTSERPNSTSLYIGFQYFDTTLSKPIYVSAINGSVVTWVDATGTQV